METFELIFKIYYGMGLISQFFLTAHNIPAEKGNPLTFLFFVLFLAVVWPIAYTKKCGDFMRGKIL